MGENQPDSYGDTGESGEAYDTEKTYESFRLRWKTDDGEEAMLMMRWLSEILR